MFSIDSNLLPILMLMYLYFANIAENLSSWKNSIGTWWIFFFSKDKYNMKISFKDLLGEIESGRVIYNIYWEAFFRWYLSLSIWSYNTTNPHLKK